MGKEKEYHCDSNVVKIIKAKFPECESIPDSLPGFTFRFNLNIVTVPHI